MKKVLITGGHGDIAREIKVCLEEEGYDVYAPSRTEMDVACPEQIEENIRKFVPDILINNAGYVVPQSIRNGDLESMKKHFDINLDGVFYCTAIALRYNPSLKIINIGSAAAVEPHATWSEYCASKAAVMMASKCWAEDGLYCVCLSPGRTRTKMRSGLFPDEDQQTLLDPADFAKIVMKAVHQQYASGSHIVVRKQNVAQLLSE